MDPALQTIVQRSKIDMDLQSYLPVIEFVNGQFRGVLNLREVNNRKFVESNHGYDDDYIDMFENFEFKVGTSDVLERIFELGNNINESGAYDELKQLLDIDEFTNYMAAELFLGSNDWPHNNVKAYRNQDDGRYRFVFFDLDFAFKNSDPFADIYDHQTNTSYSDVQYMDFCKFFINLLNNEEYRKKFIDTYCIIAGSVFDSKRVNDIVDELADHVRPMMQLEGWKSPDTSANKIKQEMQTRMSRMINCMVKFKPMNLTGVTKQQVQLSADTEGATILVNGIEVPYTEFNGTLFRPAVLEAKAPAGYIFKGWKKNSSDNVFNINNVINLPTESKISLVACFQPMTDDELRQNGVAPVKINEISATNETFVNEYWKKNDWVELYNTTDEPIDVEGMYLSDNPDKPQKYQISRENSEASTIIQPHGFLIVWCDKLAPISQLHANFKLAKEGGEVLLTAADESWTDRLSYTEHEPDETIGRYPDGAAEVFMMNVPTIAKNNITSSYVTPVEQTVPTGINNITDMAENGNDGISIRPADGKLTLYSNMADNLHLNVATLAGQAVFNSDVQLSNGYSTVSISQLPVGVYVAYISDSQGHKAACKFIVR